MKFLFKNVLFLLGFVGLLLASWIMVHVLAFFGIFLALLIPVWWFLLPKYNFCLLCRMRRVGDWCPVCRQKVTRDQHAITVRSIVFNIVFVLFFSILSIGLVFAESRLFIISGMARTLPSVNFTIPTKAHYKIGEIFPMKLEIAGIITPVNAVQADIAFDPSKLEVTEISTKDSFAIIFIQKEINNQTGFARLTGGLPNPGYAKSKGLFGTVYFRAKTAGLVSVTFLPTTMALANDGIGTNVLKNLGSVSYLIIPEKISQVPSPTPQDTKVLGANSEETQMILFDEGASSASNTGIAQQDVSEKQSNSTQTILIEWVNDFDNDIFQFWQKVFSL